MPTLNNKMKESFRKSLEQGYKSYLSTHPRSAEKIAPIHQCIADIILNKLGGNKSDFAVKSMRIDKGDKKEHKYQGAYYPKDIDITVLYKNKPISGLGFKFITSNYKQNTNNYFENMLGETANLKRADFLYGQLLVLKHKMPYYGADKKTFTKIEHINNENLSKYIALHNDSVSGLFHKPDIIYIAFIETGDELEFEKIVNAYKSGKTIKIKKLDFHKKQRSKVGVKFIESSELTYDELTLNFLNKVGNFEDFIQAFVRLTQGKTYAK